MFEKESRNAIQRIPQRGHYDRETVFAILDAGFLCHVGFQVENQPFVIPTLYGRDGESIYLHGAPASRLLKQLATGVPVCLTVTHVDGFVIARSAFHHSMNYRSAVVFGTATLVSDQEKEHGLFVISEQVIPGRWAEARQPTDKELGATSVLKIQIETASAKIRSGPPKDEPEDYPLPIWAGVIPTRPSLGQPVWDVPADRGIEMPSSVSRLQESVRGVHETP